MIEKLRESPISWGVAIRSSRTRDGTLAHVVLAISLSRFCLDKRKCTLWGRKGCIRRSIKDWGILERTFALGGLVVGVVAICLRYPYSFWQSALMIAVAHPVFYRSIHMLSTSLFAFICDSHTTVIPLILLIR